MVAKALERLFSTYPQFGRSDDPADRVKAASVYFEALATYEAQDIEGAVANLLSGRAPGVNAAFPPPAPVVAAETRRVMNLRLDALSRRYAPRNQLPAPTIERTDESRANVKAMVEAVVAVDTEAQRIAEEARREGWAKVNARFDADLTSDTMLERLGYTTTDSDVEGDMGGRAA